MKKNTGKKLILIIMLALTLTTGCTKYLSDNDKKRITNEKTGQSLTSNILCKPEEKELTAIYEKYEKNMEVKLKDLPSCEKLKIYNKKERFPDLFHKFSILTSAWNRKTRPKQYLFRFSPQAALQRRYNRPCP